MDSTSEQTESTEVNPVNEKIKKKLKEYAELKCLYNLSNAALLFKRNISLLCQERIEKNLNINPKKNNYYSGKNSSLDVFNLKDITKDIFGEYINKHNINIEEEVKKMEMEKEEKQKMGKKGAKMEKKYMAIKAVKDRTENNLKDGKGGRKNYNYYVVNENKKSIGKNNNSNNNVKIEVINNCKRSSGLDKKNKKENEEKNEEKKEENKAKNIIIINSRNRNNSRNENRDEKKEEKADNTEKNSKTENTSKKKNLERNRSKNNIISSIKKDFEKNEDEKTAPKEKQKTFKFSRFLIKRKIKLLQKRKLTKMIKKMKMI